MLQIGLGLVARSRNVIEYLYDSRINSHITIHICSTFQETRCFKVSAAVSNRNSSAQELEVENGLIQVVSNNFNANRNTQNGIKQTNGISTIVSQTKKQTFTTVCKTRCSQTKARRTQKHQANRNQDHFLKKKKKKKKETKITFFKDQKRHPISKEFSITSVLPLKVLCEQLILHERTKYEDFKFIKSILKNDETPDYNGYNAINIRNNGQSQKPR